MFFTSSETERKRKIAQLHSFMLVFNADSESLSHMEKAGQRSFMQPLVNGFGLSADDLQEVETMSFLEMVSVLRKCSYFYKRTYAESLSVAFNNTSKSAEVESVLKTIAFECDIPRDFFIL